MGLASVLALSSVLTGCDDEADGTTTSTSSSSGTGGSTTSSGSMMTSTSSGMMGGNNGDACTSDAECNGGKCLTQQETGFPKGYCSTACMDDSECGGDYCFNGFCFANCAADPCRTGYDCVDVNGDMSVLACGPACMANTDCATPAECVTDDMQSTVGLCVEDEVCSDTKDNDLDGIADCPDPDCAADATCQMQITQACTAPPTATAMQMGDNTDGTSLFVATCPGFFGDFTTGFGKEDVYQFTTPQAGELHISSTATAGDHALYVRKDCDDPMTNVACSDNAVDVGETEQIDLVVAAGDKYFIYVDAYDTTFEGAYDLDVNYIPAVCGDGMVTLPEECDDSGMVPGDGCDASCKVEDAFVCAAATPIVGGTPAMGDTAGTSNGFLPTNMGAVQNCFTGSGAGNEKIYVYTPTATGQVEIKLASATDQGFYVRTACTTDTSETVCQDAQFGGTDEIAVADVTLATPIFVIVDAFGGKAENGPFTLTVAPVVCGDGVQNGSEECDDHNLMSGDGCDAMCKVEPAFLCNNATPISLGMTMGDNSNGSSIFEAPADQAQCTAGAGTGRESLYKYTPATSGMLTITLSSAGADMGVYARTTCLMETSQVGCADETFQGDPQVETLKVPVTANTPITIFVDGYNSNAGPFTLTLAQQ